jgi:hypothetical protein
VAFSQTTYSVDLKCLVQLGGCLCDHSSVVAHIDNPLHERNCIRPIFMPLLVHGVELLANGVEFAGEPLVAILKVEVTLT